MSSSAQGRVPGLGGITNCRMTRALVEHVTSKWGVLVLLVLADGPMRWGELKRAIDGVSEKMLVSTLRTLEADGLVDRESLPVVPPHVSYSLTPTGQEAATLLTPLVRWAFDYANPDENDC
ncbi:MAG: helix-turn-helix, HxlR type [Marmoricola sp.]|jgi:DNA-binding HxlR family transcriptional regulator|nr:helix-turn-helix, HxlR type [Marmoricola sp.]